VPGHYNQEFLTRNNQPYAIDVDVDAGADDRHLGGVGDVPVFICRGEKVLRSRPPMTWANASA
jgi:hypothetical protein